ncbi:MAG: GNAT family N-acetyltransferase [Acidimicrobiales bacterium]
MTVRLREAAAGDLERIRVVEIEAGSLFRAVGLGSIADGDPPSVEWLAARLAHGSLWVAELDGAVVGYAAASVVDGEGHLDQVSVAPGAQRRGIGRRLVEQVCRWAANHGRDSVTLTTFRDVPWNGPYYERLGFVALTEGECGPELLAIRQAERDAGIDVAPRLAMRRHLPPGSS